MYTSSIASRLKDALVTNGVKQKYFAKSAGISVSLLSSILTGRRTPSIESARLIYEEMQRRDWLPVNQAMGFTIKPVSEEPTLTLSEQYTVIQGIMNLNISEEEKLRILDKLPLSQ